MRALLEEFFRTPNGQVVLGSLLILLSAIFWQSRHHLDVSWWERRRLRQEARERERLGLPEIPVDPPSRGTIAVIVGMLLLGLAILFYRFL